jgi:redox-sensitive bicupin YhaK (pirin superfamily)
MGHVVNASVADEERSEEKVVVGRGIYFLGPTTSIETLHPITVVHIRQKAGTQYQVPIESTAHGGMVINLKGSANFGGDGATSAATPQNEYDVLVLKNDDSAVDQNGRPDSLLVTTSAEEDAEYVVATGERIGESWAKKLVANGALIAATPEEARNLALKVDAMSKAGLEKGGSFAPFGI